VVAAASSRLSPTWLAHQTSQRRARSALSARALTCVIASCGVWVDQLKIIIFK
jgi:hypothetical protein